jgi:hypothetical protein
MTVRKALPMKVDDECDVCQILKYRHTIPYHSRPFMWTRDRFIERTVEESLEYWGKEDPYWLGVVLMYTGESIPAISDAQHRLTIVFLMIKAIADLLKESNAEYATELLSWISEYGRASVLRTVIPPEDSEVLTRFGWTRYPNIESCYEHDFEALGNILNDRGKPEDSPDSFLYDGYAAIYAILQDRLEPEDYTNFAQFLHDNVRVTRISISDWRFSIVVFGSFNNIKVEVPISFLIKNKFAQMMGAENSAAIHTVFEELRRRKPKNCEQYIHWLVNLYAKQLMTKDTYEKEWPTHIDDGTLDPLGKLVAIDAVVQSVYATLAADAFGSLFTKYFASGHEVFSLCLIPLGYTLLQAGKKKEFLAFVRALVAFGIRSGKAVNFNSMKFQTFLQDKMNKILAGTIVWNEAVATLTAQLKVWLGPETTKERVIGTLAEEKYDGKKFQRARAILLYLVEATDRHESQLNHDRVDIDHIYPQKPSKKHAPLATPDNKHRLGNFTPLVSVGTTEEMRGNKQLGNKLFEVKVDSYKLSNIAITRSLAIFETTGFMDIQIEERTRDLCAALESATARDLL